MPISFVEVQSSINAVKKFAFQRGYEDLLEIVEQVGELNESHQLKHCTLQQQDTLDKCLSLSLKMKSDTIIVYMYNKLAAEWSVSIHWTGILDWITGLKC